MTTRTLIKGATLVTMDAQTKTPSTGDILVQNGCIVDVGAAIDAAGADIVAARDMIAMPGFVDTHRHTWQTSVRHTCTDVPAEAYFGGFLAKKGPRYRPEDVYIGNLLGALGAINSGITTMLDWSQIQNSPEHADAAIAGLRDAGLRAVFAHGFPLTDMNAWANDSKLLHPSDIVRLRKGALCSDDGLITLAMAGRGPELAADGVWQADLALARELGIRSSIHMGAFPFNGAKRAITRLAAAGLLGADLTFIHCCCCADEEFKMMADAGVSASLGVNVEQNCQGIGDIPFDRLLAHGIRPSLSGDAETLGCGDMFTQMRQAIGYYRSWVGGGHSRAANAPSTLTSRDALEFATMRGAEANGLVHKIGSITIGKAADIVLINRDDINLTPVADPIAAVVHGAHPGNVDTVMVAGRILKRHGSLTHVGLESVRDRARASQDHILS